MTNRGPLDSRSIRGKTHMYFLTFILPPQVSFLCYYIPKIFKPLALLSKFASYISIILVKQGGYF